VIVVLEALDNVLRVGQNDATREGTNENRFAGILEECSGLDKLEELQAQENVEIEIYQKAVQLVKTYFGGEEEDMGDGQPQMGQGGMFQFGQGGGPTGGNVQGQNAFSF